MWFSDSADNIAGKDLKVSNQEIMYGKLIKWTAQRVVRSLANDPLTGICVRRATNALDVKHTTEVTAKLATCLRNFKTYKITNRNCANLGKNYCTTFLSMPHKVFNVQRKNGKCTLKNMNPFHQRQ